MSDRQFAETKAKVLLSVSDVQTKSLSSRLARLSYGIYSLMEGKTANYGLVLFSVASFSMMAFKFPVKFGNVQETVHFHIVF